MTHGVTTRIRHRTGSLLAAAIVATALTTPARALDLRLATENDFFTSSNSDDFYTFSVALSADKGPYTFSLRENAFTDQQAGTRFDETYLTVRHAIPGLEPWNFSATLGVARVGRGLFGQDAQNALHRFIGEDELDLRYVSSRLHPSVAVEAERAFAITRDVELGPRLEAASVPGFRSHAVLAAQARWQAARNVAVHLLLGGQGTDSSFAPLDRHLASFAPIARLGLVLHDLVFVSWSYNDYGNEREHLSLGVRIPDWNWRAATDDRPRSSIPDALSDPRRKR
ncbi:MAG: hypothetical protein ACRD0X_04620 [Thermoanaerobaculia bacterium]